VLTKKGAQIDRMIALRNGRDPDAMIRRVAQEQDVDGDGIPDSIDGYDDRCNQEGDCTQNPDGSFHCVFTSQCQPTGGGYGDNDPEGCDEAELFALLTSLFFTGAAQYYGLVWLMYLALIDQGYFGVVLYMANCL
jgi:hypothetical protein